MENTIYVQLRYRMQMQRDSVAKLRDIAKVIAADQLQHRLEDIEIFRTPSKIDKKFMVLDVIAVINKIKEAFPNLDIQIIGPTETIIEFEGKKKSVPIIFFVVVWLLLFIGAGMAIMNFHEETSMQTMHQKLYWMMTGVKNDKPYLVQIPYSIGLGLGMILFFNHLFKKRINEEPSPLEIEMFNYQQDLDQYVIMNKHKESTKYSDDH